MRRELPFISIKLPCVSTSLHHSTHKGINLIQIRVRWIEMDRDQQSIGGRWRNMVEWRDENEDNTRQREQVPQTHDSSKISWREGYMQFNTIRDNITPHNLTNIDINKKNYYHSKKIMVLPRFWIHTILWKQPILHTPIQIIYLYFTILLLYCIFYKINADLANKNLNIFKNNNN